MDLIWILIIAIPAGIIGLIVLSMIFGTGFRQLDEGADYKDGPGNEGCYKTFFIGLFFVILIAAIYSQCS